MMVIEQEHKSAGKLRSLGIPYSFSNTPARVSSPPPILGDHTEEILKNLIGMKKSEISDLKRTGII